MEKKIFWETMSVIEHCNEILSELQNTAAMIDSENEDERSAALCAKDYLEEIGRYLTEL